jgi:hypothetical protein
MKNYSKVWLKKSRDSTNVKNVSCYIRMFFGLRNANLGVKNINRVT